MNICKIIIKEQSKPDEELFVDLEVDEVVLLRAYLVEYNRLSNSRPLQQRLPCEMTIRFTKESGVSVKGDFPPDDDFAVLLHRMRPFILQEEPISFINSTAILGKRLPHPVFREYLKEQHRFWDGRMFTNSFPIIINGTRLNPEKILNDWLNAYEYHRDDDRAGNFQELRQRLLPGLMETIITSHTLNKLRAVRNTAFLLGLLLGEINQLEFEPYTFIREA